MSEDSFPRKVSTLQASQKSLFGGSGTGDASLNAITEFLHVVWGKTSNMLAGLSPDEFHRIQFWSTGWEVIDMDAWMIFKELLCLRRDMNFVAIPDQKDGTRREPQHLLQENDRMLRTQVTLKGADTQAHSAQFRTDKQSAEQIQALVMIQAGAGGGRLSTRTPTALERRDQIEACFIY